MVQGVMARMLIVMVVVVMMVMTMTRGELRGW